jgi:hypothetical protein
MKNEKVKTEAAPFGNILNAFGEKKIPGYNCCFIVVSSFFPPKALINPSEGRQIPFLIFNFAFLIFNSSFPPSEGRLFS